MLGFRSLIRRLAVSHTLQATSLSLFGGLALTGSFIGARVYGLLAFIFLISRVRCLFALTLRTTYLGATTRKH